MAYMGHTVKLKVQMAKMPESRVTRAQLRAARVLLGLSTADLAAKTKLGQRTIKRAEQVGDGPDGPVNITPANEDRIVSALVDLGVQFIPSNGGGPGVRLRDDPLTKAGRTASPRKRKSPTEGR